MTVASQFPLRKEIYTKDPLEQDEAQEEKRHGVRE